MFDVRPIEPQRTACPASRRSRGWRLPRAACLAAILRRLAGARRWGLPLGACPWLLLTFCTVALAADCPAPEVVPEPPFTAGSNNAIFWIPAPGAVAHQVVRITSDGIAPRRASARAARADTLSVHFGDLEHGVQYCYYVEALFADGCVSRSDTTCSTQDARPPPRVAPLQATSLSAGGIRLSWMPQPDGVSRVPGYAIWRTGPSGLSRQLAVADSSASWDPALGAETWIDSLDGGTGMQENRLYAYRVDVFDTVGNAAIGDDSNAAWSDNAAPVAPTLYWRERGDPRDCGYDHADFGNDRFFVRGDSFGVCIDPREWNNDRDDYTRIDSLRFEVRRDDPDRQCPAPGDDLCRDSGWLAYPFGNHPRCSEAVCWQVENLTHDHVYYYRARAKDRAGNTSPWSETRHATPDGAPPDPVCTPYGTIHLEGNHAGAIEVTWERVTDGVSGVKLYLVERLDEDHAPDWLVLDHIPGHQGGGSISYFDRFDDQTWQRPVAYRVRAQDNVGNLSPSSPCSVQVRPPLPPIPFLPECAAGGSLQVLWTDYDTGGVDAYDLEVGQDVIHIADGTRQDTTIAAPAGVHFVRIAMRAFFRNGMVTPWSETQRIPLRDPPDPTTWIRAGENPDSLGGIRVEWAASTDPQLAGYRLRAIPQHGDVEPCAFELPDTVTCIQLDGTGVKTCDGFPLPEVAADCLPLMVHQAYRFEVRPLACATVADTAFSSPAACLRAAPALQCETPQESPFRFCWLRARPNWGEVAGGVFSAEVEAWVDANGDGVPDRRAGGWTEIADRCTEFAPPDSSDYWFRVRESVSGIAACSPTVWSDFCPISNLPPEPVQNFSATARPAGASFPHGSVVLHWNPYAPANAADSLLLRRLDDEVVVEEQQLAPADTCTVRPQPDGDCAATTYELLAWSRIRGFSDAVRAAAPADSSWAYVPFLAPLPSPYVSTTRVTRTVRWFGCDGSALPSGGGTRGAAWYKLQASLLPDFSAPPFRWESPWTAPGRPVEVPLDSLPVDRHNRVVYMRATAIDSFASCGPAETVWSTRFAWFQPLDVLTYDVFPPERGALEIAGTAAAGTDSVDVTLRWTHAEDDAPGSGTAGYALLRSRQSPPGEPAAEIAVVLEPDTTYTDRTAVPASYAYEVQPFDQLENRRASDNGVAALRVVQEPRITCLLASTPYYLEWEPVAAAPADTVEYWAEFSFDETYLGCGCLFDRDTGWIEATADTLPILGGERFVYRVKARINGVIETAWSDTITWPDSSRASCDGPPAMGDPNAGSGTAGAPPVPRVFQLSRARPNPFNPATRFEIWVPRAASVRVMVYNHLGRVVARVLDTALPAGIHQLRWDGRGTGGERQPSGVYFVRMTAPGFAQVQKIVLLR